MIVINDLSKHYSASAESPPVLTGLALTLAQGASLAILGRSGSGKSTLLNAIGGLDRGWTGSIRIAGRFLETMSDAALSRLRGATLGFVFQNPTFLPHLSNLDNLRFAQRFARGLRDDDALLQLMDKVDLRALATARPPSLSGGQRQRLALARALCGDPKIVLADEPTGNLDDATGQSVVDLLMAEHAAGRTLVVVTHDARIAARCERVLTLVDGKLTEGAP